MVDEADLDSKLYQSLFYKKTITSHIVNLYSMVKWGLGMDAWALDSAGIICRWKKC